MSLKGLRRGLKKIEKGVVRPVVKEAGRGLGRVEHSLHKDILPVVVGAGRRRVKTSHVQTDFERESIQLIVTAGEK